MVVSKNKMEIKNEKQNGSLTPPNRDALDSLYARADEISRSLTSNQRGLIGLLAFIDGQELSNREAAEVLTAFANESKSKERFRIMQLADAVGKREDPIDAMDKIPGLLPVSTILGLKLAKSDAELPTFYQLFRNRQIVSDEAVENHSDTVFVRGVRLLVVTLVMMAIISFICMYIIPEFMKMNEEFGLDQPPVMKLFLTVADTLVKTWFLPFFGFIAILIYVYVFQPQILGNYLRRWRRGAWLQVVLPRRLERRRLLSWVTEAKRTLSEDVNRFMRSVRLAKPLGGPEVKMGEAVTGEGRWNTLASRRTISKREAKALSLATSQETRAWLLRQSIEGHLQRGDFKVGAYAEFVFGFVRLALAAIVTLAAFSIFSVLLNVMEGFQ